MYSHTRALSLSQKSLNEAKKRVSNATPKTISRSRERVMQKIQISKINCKIKSAREFRKFGEL